MEKKGIINDSSNCNINVIIQMLLENKLISKEIIKYLEYENNLINIKKIKKILENKINTSIQNDAHEIFLLLAEKIKIIENEYKFKIMNNFKCKICNTKRKKKEELIFLPMYTTDIHDAIKNYFNMEELELECEKCKMTCKTEKYNSIIELPKNILFHNINKNKLIFPNDFKLNNKIYHLIGTVNHIGKLFNYEGKSGHYIYNSYKSNCSIDDDIISKNILKGNEYLLIYSGSGSSISSSSSSDSSTNA